MSGDHKTKRNIKPFDGTKYSIWKLRVRAVLAELKVLSAVDSVTTVTTQTASGDNSVASGASEISDDSDLKAKNVILEYLADSHIHFVSNEKSARDIFLSLDAIYERKSLAAQISIKKKLLALKFQGQSDLMKFFTVFDDLMTELSAAGATLTESDKVAHLLVTLPSSYDGIVTAIETLSENNLTLAFVKTRLLDHETKLKGDDDTSPKVLLLDHQKRKFPLKGSKFNSQKFNPNIKKKNNFKPFQKKSMGCFHCGRKNHVIKDCIYRRNQSSQNSPRPNLKSVKVKDKDDYSPESANISAFAFMAGESQGNQEAGFWILDSGASAHISKTDAFFNSSVTLDPPMKIAIAKSGAFITALKKGNINVTTQSGFSGLLEDVLFCPEVPHNLLSVKKIQEAGFTVTFDQKGVQITKGSTVFFKGDQPADLLTKPLPTPTFLKFRAEFGLQSASTE
ncbi:unnamed protein product [Bemisia tabaci]|uniref:CCHC-type domain-containing protein n=1 Tax=Bemisia tabaci TaxID=7038 RepID=A0A9N9ZZ67_BEMTA|nr:unnamed protein product [Bemisia tabaci]